MTNLTIPEKRSLNNEISYWKRKNKNGSTECYSKEYFNSDFSRRYTDINEVDSNKELNIIDEILELLNDDSLIYQQLKYGTKKYSLQGDELENQIILDYIENELNNKNEINQISELHYELSHK